jgi:hypothetical protein
MGEYLGLHQSQVSRLETAAQAETGPVTRLLDALEAARKRGAMLPGMSPAASLNLFDIAIAPSAHGEGGRGAAGGGQRRRQERGAADRDFADPVLRPHRSAGDGADYAGGGVDPDLAAFAGGGRAEGELMASIAEGMGDHAAGVLTGKRREAMLRGLDQLLGAFGAARAIVAAGDAADLEAADALG